MPASSEMKDQISFIGLGVMGFGMATNLISQGYVVTGYDIYEPTRERFAQAGGISASTLAEALTSKPYCICMAATAAQIDAIFFHGNCPGITHLPQDAALLIASTVPSSYVKRVQAALTKANRQDIRLIDCPVSGGAIRAAEGTLSIMVGAKNSATVESVRDILQAMAAPDKLYVIRRAQNGSDISYGVGLGNDMKSCHQILAAVQILAASEAMGFAKHLGLDLQRTADAIMASEGASFMLENRLPRIMAADHGPVASAISIITKDVGIIMLDVKSSPPRMTQTAEQMYFQAIGRGWETDDDGSLIRLYGRGVTDQVAAEVLVAIDDAAKTSLVIDLLRAIHLCAAAECLTYGRRLGLELAQVLKVCINAAGWSRTLEKYGSRMAELVSDEGLIAEAEPDTCLEIAVLKPLEKAMQMARHLRTPLFLSAQAYGMLGQSVSNNVRAAEVASIIRS